MDKQISSPEGLNRTGAKVSPIDAGKTAQGAQDYTLPNSGNSNALAENRIRFMRESGPVGTVPMPPSPKGVFASLKEKFKIGDHAFIDKLGERIAFERTGVRLYDALLSKYHGSKDQSAFPELATLERFRDEEKKHFHLACRAMETIGGDCTSMTPSADLAGVAGLGLVQVISDSRTNFKQSLEYILQAELIDNACWEVLIELAREVGGMNDLVEEFELALEEESVHLATIKEWVRQFNLSGKVQRTFKH